jgi:hypothetical protein
VDLQFDDAGKPHYNPHATYWWGGVGWWVDRSASHPEKSVTQEIVADGHLELAKSASTSTCLPKSKRNK